MRKLSLIACLALAALPAAAQGADRSWTGSALHFTASSVEGCNLTLGEAATRNGFVHVTLRNATRGILNVTIGGELAGDGKRSIGTGHARLPAGQNSRIQMMRVYAGSLAGSVLTLRVSGCSVVG